MRQKHEHADFIEDKFKNEGFNENDFIQIVRGVAGVFKVMFVYTQQAANLLLSRLRVDERVLPDLSIEKPSRARLGIGLL